jgi:hypothetical protein
MSALKFNKIRQDEALRSIRGVKSGHPESPFLKQACSTRFGFPLAHGRIPRIGISRCLGRAKKGEYLTSGVYVKNGSMLYNYLQVKWRWFLIAAQAYACAAKRFATVPRKKKWIVSMENRRLAKTIMKTAI